VENVNGLTFHNGDCSGREPLDCPGCYLACVIMPEATRRFAWAEWRVLDAASFGVPQRRLRWILVCGPRPIRWPDPTHADPAEIRQGALFGPALKPWRTVRQALNLGGSMQNGVADLDNGYRGVPRSTDEPSPAVGCAGNLYTERVIGIATAHGPGERVNERDTVDLTDMPARTVSAEQSATRGGAMAVVRSALPQWHGAGKRRLSVVECAILQDVTADYPFQGTATSQYRQCGNAVPPTLACVVARAVIKASR